jgi:hypothetical protein
MELIGEVHTYVFGQTEDEGDFPVPHQQITFYWIKNRNQYRVTAQMLDTDHDVEGYFDDHSSELAHEIFCRYNKIGE